MNGMASPLEKRRRAAQALLDVLHMRKGMHEGLTSDEVKELWAVVNSDDGFPSVVAFLDFFASRSEPRGPTPSAESASAARGETP